MVWDFRELLHVSAYDVFKWEPSPKRPWWQRRMSWSEFLTLAHLLAQIDGTLTQESVLHDPVVVKWMAEQSSSGSGKPRLWRFTREINMMSTLIDAEVGKTVMKRPDIPGDKLREKNNQNKLRNTLSRIGVQ